MPELTTAEVAPKVIVRERLPATPAAGSKEALAQNIVQRIDQGEWREGLELANKIPIEDKKISEKLEQIGTERDPATGKKQRSAQEQVRYQEADKYAKAAKKFLEKGYDGMTLDEKRSLRDAVLAESNLRPMLASEIASLTLTQRQEYAERILKDPKLDQEVRRFFEDLLDPEKKLLDVSDAQDIKEKADSDLEDARAEKRDHDRIWEMNSRRLAEYEEQKLSDGTSQKGENLAQLENIEKQIQTAQGEQDGANQALESALQNVKRLQDELGVFRQQASSGLVTGGGRNLQLVEQELRQAQATEVNARQTMSQAEERLAKLQGEQERLKDENRELLERQKQLDTERRTIERKVKDAEREAAKRQWNLQDQLTIRESQEQDLVDGFKNTFREATSQYINSQVEQIDKLFTTEIEELKQKTTDQNEKAMYDALQTRWRRVITRTRGFVARRREEYRPLDRQAIDSDFGNLIKEGPERVMRDLLMSRVNPRTGTSYTEAEANEILANKDYVAKMQPEVVRQLLAKKLVTGGISEPDLDVITNSQWGKEMIDKALQQNSDLRNLADKMRGEHALGSKGFWERFRDNLGKNKWWWLLILGLVGLPLFAGLAAVKKEAVAV